MWGEWPFRQVLVRLNSVPNAPTSPPTQTALCYRKIRSFFVRIRWHLCPCNPISHCPNPIRVLKSYFRLQTKKLRRIDCNNRYCVWSIAHPQPVNLCQPCYCDKVREGSSHLGAPLNLPSLTLFPIPHSPLPSTPHGLTQFLHSSLSRASFSSFLSPDNQH